MKKFTVFVLFVCAGFVLSRAQTTGIGFDVDYTQFAFDRDSNIVEFYYMFDSASMLKVQKDSLFYVGGLLKISVEDSLTGRMIINKQWRFSNQESETNESSQSFVGVLSFVFPKGVYKCTFTGSNYNDTLNSKSYTETIVVNPLISDNISLSGLELASRILPESHNKNSIFYKNTYEVIPVPNVLFGDNQPVLFYYLELYELNNATTAIPLILNTRVFDSKGKLYINKNGYLTHKENSRVEVGSVNVNKFPTGPYTLQVSLIDSTKNYGISSSKKFFVYNSKILNQDTLQSADIKLLNTEFFSLSEEELDDIFSKSKYIASSDEIDQYEGLSTVEAKKEFLNQFWKKRDKNPSTPRNEFFEDYFRRIEYANQKFGTIRTSGWMTDRGRVYVTYGPPSEIDRYPNVQNTKPYEIWQYNDIEGGVQFIFGDLIGLSNYQLLHSTKRGEINDPNWERRIRAL